MLIAFGSVLVVSRALRTTTSTSHAASSADAVIPTSPAPTIATSAMTRLLFHHEAEYRIHTALRIMSCISDQLFHKTGQQLAACSIEELVFYKSVLETCNAVHAKERERCPSSDLATPGYG